MARDKIGKTAKRTAVLAVLLAFSSEFVFAAAALAPTLARFTAGDRAFIEQNAGSLRLSFSAEGRLVAASLDSGEVRSRVLEDKAAGKVLDFLSRLPKDDPELGMALAMQSYLAPRMDPRSLDDNAFVKRDGNGRLGLTLLGKNALVDILTASDGGLLEPPAKAINKGTEVVTVGKDGKRIGVPASAGGLHSAGSLAASAPGKAFDGRHELGDFDWKNLDGAVSAAGGLRNFAKTAAGRGYFFDEKAGTVRVLVAAERSAKSDHLKVPDSDAVKNEVYRQTGLDAGLLDRHGAKLVRVVDNIVAVDVPLPSAAKLGFALKASGIESRPARVYRSAAAAAHALADSPAAPLLGGQFLPLPTDAFASKSVAPKLVESRVSVDVEGFDKYGMSGRGAYVGVIDSGVDMDHPDFKDGQGRSRIREYIDFTEEGKDDSIGHGTHVNGIIGGSGAASKGKFEGMAPDARFKVAKVFGTKGETDESVILAAMKWMKEGRKVDLINMSLGGPGAPNKDPLSSLANQLTVKDNILVVAAAGNEGPFDGSVGSPGNGRYVLTVGGVDKEGKPVFFSSRGPIHDENGEVLYSKPDLVGVAGGVDFSAIERQMLLVDSDGKPAKDAAGGLAKIKAVPVEGGKCVYAPGIISARSGADEDKACAVKGYPGYRFMSGTSQAAPMASGFGANVIGYLKANGKEADALEVRALLMETSVDLKEKKEFQGSGLINGTRVADAVIDRVKRGIPVGNIAYSLAMRLTSSDEEKLKSQNRYEATPVGLLDKETGHLLNTEEQLQKALEDIRRKPAPLLMVEKEAEVVPV